MSEEFYRSASGENDSVNTDIYSADQKAAIVLYALGPNRAEEVFAQLDEKDHRAFARALHHMEPVTPEITEKVLYEFIGMFKSDGPIRGGSAEARRFLAQMLPGDSVDRLMSELEGRFDANVWERMSTASEQMLATYLKGEQMQTIAVVLSRIKAEKAARVLDFFPPERAKKIIFHMSRLGSIDVSVLEDVQQALRNDFLSVVMKQSSSRRPVDIIAAILNGMTSQRASDMIDYLHTVDEPTAEAVQRTMFTFNDFITRISPSDIQKIIKAAESGTLLRALKMAKERQPKVAEYFLANMSKRASEMLRDELDNMPPIRAKDAEQAQTEIIEMTRTMAKNGEIEISENNDPEAEAVF